MARCDVYANPYGDGYLLDVQADVLDHYKTRVVVPLLPAETVPPPLRRLNPTFDINGKRVIMATQLMSAVSKAPLEHPVANLSRHHDEIVGALDMLFQGF